MALEQRLTRLWETRPGLRGWLGIWNRWDALNYQKIAQFGYSATGELKPRERPQVANSVMDRVGAYGRGDVDHGRGPSWRRGAYGSENRGRRIVPPVPSER